MTVHTGLISGVLSGIIIAVAGYLKSHSYEEFDEQKFLQTIVIGCIVGFTMAVYGWSYVEAEQWLGNMGIITLVEYLKKWVKRTFKK